MASELKFARLIQPRNPLFWVLIVLNGLSSAISFVLHAYQLPIGTRLLLAGFALGNVIAGIVIALHLMAGEPLRDARDASDGAGTGR
ncbi:hypothetical protein [Sulfuritalea sp.]|uniref:hypothetical protein n=1 Tax=Sulfuritalea sp. TaxID=2480090 RepID=UPI00286D8937|nr:hypothetical protein [Sulfuritalea sp.]